MLVLTVRTDKPESELGLYEDGEQKAYYTWQAHRELAETIHLKIRDLLDSQEKELKNLQGIVVFKGPGSFTGLRIGIAVANALADGLSIPIVGEMNEKWITTGTQRLQNHKNDRIVVPEYGAPVHITPPKR